MSEKTKSTLPYQQYLQDGGEMGELTRTFDWSDTVLGHPDTWSPNLLITLGIILKSRFPMFLWWGPELIQFYNDAYRPSMGNTGKHPLALGQKGEECWPEIWPEIKPMIDQVMTSGESTWNEDRLIPIYRNGRLEDVYWTFSYSQVTDETGTAGGVLVICHETTEKVKLLQKEIESAKVVSINNQKLASAYEDLSTAQNLLSKTYHHAREQEENLRRIIEQSPVAMAIFSGPEFIIEVFNQKVLELWGRTAEQVRSKALFEAIPEARNQGFEELLNRVAQSGKVFKANERPVTLLRNDNPETFWINFVFEPLKDFDGSISRIMVVCNDVTEQVIARKKIEESEKRFKQIADFVTQMIWVTDGKGMHEYYNQRWYDFTGTTFEQVKGEGWNNIFHPDDRERAWATWKFSLETGKDYSIEYRILNRNGNYVWVLGRASPFYNEAGVITKWFGTCTDINEQKLLMQQKDDFISIASHELKTPITSLTASLQLLNRIKDDPSAKGIPRLIEGANKSLDKVSQLIKDLLNVTQFNNGQLNLTKSWFTLSDLIEECCQQIRAQDGYIVKTQGNMDLKVCADALRIDQVIVNLVNNAIKYAPGSKDILITIESMDKSAKVSVSDKGPGIVADKIPHLFDRYFRVDSSGSQYSGLGLGLYISGEIIKKHGGQIGVNSRVGEGSTFWFTLPY